MKKGAFQLFYEKKSGLLPISYDLLGFWLIYSNLPATVHNNPTDSLHFYQRTLTELLRKNNKKLILNLRLAFKISGKTFDKKLNCFDNFKTS